MKQIVRLIHTIQGLLVVRRRFISLSVLTLTCGLVAAVGIGLGTVDRLGAQTSLEASLTPAEQDIVPGDNAEFTVTLTNTGAVTLTDIVVYGSASILDCRNTVLSDLAPGDPPHVYTCSSLPLWADRWPQIDARGEPAGMGWQVSTLATAFVRAEHLRVDKLPELQSVDVGESATFNIQVANLGGFTLTDVAVSDMLVPDCGRSAGQLVDLGPYQTEVYTCNSAALGSDLWDRVEATALISSSTSITDRNESVVQVDQALHIGVAPLQQSVLLGEAASVQVTLRNEGDGALGDVSVSAPTAPDCTRSVGTLQDLPADGYVSYVCQSEPIITNTTIGMLAAATDGGIEEQVSAETFVRASPLQLAISPAYQFLPNKETVTFTVHITNLHDSHILTKIVVKAPHVPDCARAQGSLPALAPSGHITYVCQAGPALQYIRNEMQVSAADWNCPTDIDPDLFVASAVADAGMSRIPIVIKGD